MCVVARIWASFSRRASIRRIQIEGIVVEFVLFVLFGAVILGALLVVLLLWSRRRMIPAGIEVGNMIGATVIASTPLEPTGWVKYAGEDWSATLEPPTTSVAANAELEVVAVKGLHMRVRPRPRFGLSESNPVSSHELS